jgi:hypothetical protein
MKRNITIAVILLVLFALFAIIGVGIWKIQNNISRGERIKSNDDDEEDDI